MTARWQPDYNVVEGLTMQTDKGGGYVLVEDYEGLREALLTTEAMLDELVHEKAKPKPAFWLKLIEARDRCREALQTS